MFEATNAESPTYYEKLDVTLKTIVKINIPYTNMGGGRHGINSIILNSLAETIL